MFFYTRKKLAGVIIATTMLAISGCSMASGNKEEQTISQEVSTQILAEDTEEATEEWMESTTEIIPESTEFVSEMPYIDLDDIKLMAAGEILYEEDLAHIDTDDCFYISEIEDSIFSRMDGNSYGEDCIVDKEELRYLRVLHRGFDGETHIGELVCNQALAEDFLDIFKELYKEDYPIEKMHLVDDYNGDDEASMEDNNTSCFNFRPVPGSDHLSQHAYGRAIDINPLYNPYITNDGYTPYNAGDYVDRSKDTPHKIDYDDLCYKVFDAHGFLWGGTWNSVKDYQHFQKKQ